MDLAEKYSQLCAERLGGASEEQLREELQSILSAAFRAESERCSAAREIISECRKMLREIENKSVFEASFFQGTDPGVFFGELSYACDIALSAAGRRVVFSAQSTACRRINRAALSRAFLNLVSNAALYSSGGEISISVRPARGCVILGVDSEGSLDFLRVQRSLADNGRGLCCVRRAAELHSGTLFFFEGGGRVRFRLSVGSPVCDDSAPGEDFAALLCNRLSPIYTGLSTVPGL